MMRLHRHVHFVGIGGVGMSAIARVLLAMGVGVSGSDLKMNATLEKLRGLGARSRSATLPTTSKARTPWSSHPPSQRQSRSHRRSKGRHSGHAAS